MKIEIKEKETFIKNDIIIYGVKIGEVELCPERHEISRLVIFEPYQNKGYGTTVIKQLMNKGYNSSMVRSDNPRAIHFYEKCGFVKTEKTMFELKASEKNE